MSGNDNNDPLSILDTVSHFIDSYLRVFRLLPWLLAGSGVLLVYRHSRGPMRRFFKATDVPQSCIESHVPLRGVVVRVCTDSVAVWHVPVWSRWFKPPSPSSVERCELIQLRIAGVSLYPASEQWLQDRLCGRKMTFVPLSLCGDHLHSILYTRIGWRRVCVNTELVARRLAGLDQLDTLPNSSEGLLLTQKLLASEIKAKKWRPW